MSTRTRLSSDWMGILILAFIAISRGVMYLPFIIPEGHRIPAIENFFPTTVWAVIWITTGILATIGVLSRKTKGWSFAALLGLHVLWGVLYLGAWMFGFSLRGYTTALSYFGIVAIALWGMIRVHGAALPALTDR